MKDRLGHASRRTTDEVYTHVLDLSARKAAELMETAIFGTPQGSGDTHIGQSMSNPARRLAAARARPRFGLARWVWFGKLTRLAWLLAIRDGYTTTDLAWHAALGAVQRYGSSKTARRAVRAGRPVPHPEQIGNGDAARVAGREFLDRDDNPARAG